jgi:hypothetical protein
MKAKKRKTYEENKDEQTTFACLLPFKKQRHTQGFQQQQTANMCVIKMCLYSLPSPQRSGNSGSSEGQKKKA